MTADDQETRLGEWRRLALAALRRSGTAGDGDGPEQVEELLAARTYDGLRIPALQTAETTELPPFPYVRGARDQGGWDVRQRHTDGRTALTDLENGATSLWLVTGGLDWGTLDGILLDLAPVVLDSGPDFPAAGAAWFALLAARDVDPAAVSGGFGADPLGWRARTGDPSGLPGALRDAAALAGRCVAEAPGLRTITVDATLYHDAGAADAFEVACAAAAGVAYLRALTDAGLSVADALGQLEFRFAATADQFA
ncbi:MAG TPA: methylmalonyl-CoA mutase family protein, partial [Actinoplanes sp.]|nr:methylmalonyl-CoA mutase family protein [Actinoplanes sp.]